MEVGKRELKRNLIISEIAAQDTNPLALNASAGRLTRSFAPLRIELSCSKCFAFRAREFYLSNPTSTFAASEPTLSLLKSALKG